MKYLLAFLMGLLLSLPAMADVKVVKYPRRVVKVIPGGPFYWNHPHWGWGYWAYPQPPEGFYIDDMGRAVKLGFFYDDFGNLQPMTPQYYYRYTKAPNWWYWSNRVR